jgi:hypothetical protein
MLNYGENNKMLNELIKKLDQYFEITLGENINNSPQSIRKFSETDAVIIWEETNYSIYNDIICELRLCKEYDTAILGAVIVEN